MPKPTLFLQQNGAVVNHEFKVVFGLSNMGVAPAGVEKNTQVIIIVDQCR